jgi:hypothetical protein
MRNGCPSRETRRFLANSVPRYSVVLPHGEVHLDDERRVDDVEGRPAVNRLADGLALEIELVMEERAHPIEIGDRQLDDDVDVTRHPRHAVVVGGHRSGHHVRDALRIQSLRHDPEHLDLLAHCSTVCGHARPDL